LAITEEGLLYVLDSGLSVVYSFDFNGNHLATLGGPGQGPGELHKPSVLVWADPYLWVSDYGNGRLQIFEDDRYVATIKPQGMSMPKNLARAGNKIFVAGATIGEGHGRISVYTPEGRYLEDLPWATTRNADKGKTRSLWNRISLSPLSGGRLLVGYHFDSGVSFLDLTGDTLLDRDLRDTYPVYERKTQAGVFPDGYSAMSFAEGPDETLLVTICDNDSRTCSTILRFDREVRRVIQRLEMGFTVKFMKYYEDLDMLALTNKNAEVLVYGID